MHDGAAPIAFLTDFADEGVILPLILAVTVILGLNARWRLACCWVAATSGVLGAMLVLKLGCYMGGVLVPALGLEQAGLVSPSGHVASACIAYGGIVMMLAPRQGAGRLACVVSLAIAAVVGASRVALGDHSWGEVVIGAAVGTLGAVMFASIAAGSIGRVPGRALIGGTVPVLVLFHGVHFSIEQSVHSASAGLLNHLPGW